MGEGNKSRRRNLRNYATRICTSEKEEIWALVRFVFFNRIRSIYCFICEKMTSATQSRTSIDVANESSSWADLVRKVDQERKQLPWDPKTTEPVQRVSLYHVSLE